MTSPTGFRVLGPIECTHAGASAQLGGVRQRSLLALLLMTPGGTVSSARLIDELWQGTPPPGAEGTLRVYISRLRSALGETTVVARPPGYALDIRPEDVDASRFERLHAEGREALARGAAGMAADRLAAALALWRGPAYADVRDGGALADEASRLDELRYLALEDRIDAELSLGRHGHLVAELEGLVAEHPLRERLWRQLVLALYHSERQGDALAAYARARATLADRLGLDPGPELQALEQAVLRQDLTPAPPVGRRHNLPAPLTSFVGRDDDLAELANLLRTHRLVTLTGAGGTGKTRLALEAAGAQVGAWSGGVWFVDLSAQVEPEATAGTVAGVLEVPERPDVSVADGLIEHLRDQELLIVLDNCEHLVSACATLAHDLLRAAPLVRILATSRIPLKVPGEVDYGVEPLATPSDELSADELAGVASVDLFLERVRAVRREAVSTDADLEGVARICRGLDGLPLAIELAAGRAKALSVDDIALRLDDHLELLRSRQRFTPARHQTIRAAIDWSHQLLEQDERDLLSALSTFAGGFTLESVTAVCADGDGGRAEELVGRLLDSSLVVNRPGHDEARYALLQTIREYAAERLASDGARRHELHVSHAEYFLSFARQSWTEDPAGKARALELFDVERDNLDAAMRWTLEEGSDLALPLAAALWRYWLVRGHHRQGLEWLDRALASSSAPPAPPRAVALAGAALLARLLGDELRAERLADEGVRLGRAGVGPPRALIVSLNVLTTLAARRGDVELARSRCDEAVAVARADGDVRLEAMALFILAEGLLHAGRYADVEEVGGQALRLARTVGDPELTSIVLARLGMAAVHVGLTDRATEHLSEALEHARGLGFPDTAAWCCEGLALVAADRGDPALAARLLGAGESLRRAVGTVVQPAEAAAREATLTLVRGSLPAAELQAALEVGRGLSLDAAAEAGAAVAARSV